MLHGLMAALLAGNLGGAFGPGLGTDRDFDGWQGGYSDRDGYGYPSQEGDGYSGYGYPYRDYQAFSRGYDGYRYGYGGDRGYTYPDRGYADYYGRRPYSYADRYGYPYRGSPYRDSPYRGYADWGYRGRSYADYGQRNRYPEYSYRDFDDGDDD